MKQLLTNVFVALLLTLSAASVVALPATVSADSACEGALSIQYPNKSAADIKTACDTNTNPNDSTKNLGDGLTGLIKKIIDILLFIIGAVAVIMIIIGGIRYVVSGGDQGAVTGAKNTILYAVVGLVVAIMAYAIVNFVVSKL
ncbi:MAG: pilin [Candidatus Saccharimonadales bacterium]